MTMMVGLLVTATVGAAWGLVTMAASVSGPAGAVTGRSTVKVEPTSGVLVTVMSPPSIWQNLRLMASPRPVPPYLRVVEASAWLKA